MGSGANIAAVTTLTKFTTNDQELPQGPTHELRSPTGGTVNPPQARTRLLTRQQRPSWKAAVTAAESPQLLQRGTHKHCSAYRPTFPLPGAQSVLALRQSNNDICSSAVAATAFAQADTASQLDELGGCT